MSLHSDQVEPTQELPGVTANRATQRLQPLTILQHPSLDTLTRPADVTIFQQRDQVVPYGPAHGVLEIQHARIAVRQHHQIAGMVVPMHEDGRLSEPLANQKLECGADGLRLRGRHGKLQMTLTEPLRHEGELARQLLTVVGRQLAGAGQPPHLDLGEHLQRISIEPLDVIARIESGQIVRASQVLEEQQPSRHIALVDVRNVHSDRLQQLRDLQIRPDILLARGSVHDHERLVTLEGAEVPAKAGVARGRLDALGTQAEILGQPFVYQRQSRILIVHGVEGQFFGRDAAAGSL